MKALKVIYHPGGNANYFRNVQEHLDALGQTVFGFGAVVNGTTDDSAAIGAMASAVGFVRFPYGNTFVDTNTTISVPLFFDPGAYVTVNSGKTLTIRGRIDSPKQWIFRGSGTYTIGNSSTIGEDSREVHVSWFGAFPSADLSAGDQAPFIQKAMDAMGNTRESIIYFDIGNYYIDSAMTTTRGCHIKGAGTRRTIFHPDAVLGDSIFTTGETACKFSDIQFEFGDNSTVSTDTCIEIAHTDCEVYNVRVNNFDGGVLITANNCRVDHIIGVYGAAPAAGSSLVRVKASNCTVSNVRSNTSTSSAEALVWLGGSTAIANFLVENVQHISPGKAIYVDATAANVTRGTIDGVNYSGSAGSPPDYIIHIETDSTFSATDIAINNVAITSFAPNGIHLEQNSSGSITDIFIDNTTVSGGSGGIGIQFTQTAGTLSGVRVGSGVDVSERTTPFGYSGTVTARIEPEATPDANAPIAWSYALSDDTAVQIELHRSIFSCIVTLNRGATDYGLFAVRAASTPAVANISVSANVASTASSLAGTTGTDGKLTLGVQDGSLYIENRLGSAQTINLALLAGA